MRVVKVRFIKRSKYSSLVFDHPDCRNAIAREKLTISMLPYGPLASSQQKTRQIEDLDYWNKSKIQGLGKCVLSRVLNICSLKKRHKGMRLKK